MKYIDLHCDALTKEGVAVVSGESLRQGGCALQCFAAFVGESEGPFAAAMALADKFDLLCRTQNLHPVRQFCDIGEGIGALFTVEGGEALEGEIANLEALCLRGARMLTLTWNRKNELGYPNAPDYDRFGVCKRREEGGGLTSFGREAVECMAELKLLPDVSHGSDALVRDVASVCGAREMPFVASHSGAAAVYDVSRNLRDGEIGLIADCGGAVGLDFCTAFLSADVRAEGQREAILAHARHILRVGGEDVPALGSDFDGTPENPCMRGPGDIPALLETFADAFGSRIAEKIAFSNALRVLKEGIG